MEKLTFQPRINSLIKRLLEKRSLITVIVHGHAEEFNSAIIKFADDNSYFLLDELNPEVGHTLLLSSGRCHIKAHIDGISLNFDAEIAHTGEDNGISYYRILTPNSINYLQRRSAHRVSFSAANPVVVTLTTEDNQTITGFLANLSIGGLRIQFERDIGISLEKSDKLRCQFSINNDNFSIEVIVRMVRPTMDKTKIPFIGAQFYQPVPAQERQLQRLIMGLERSARKKQ